jgi:hypothetical protein
MKVRLVPALALVVLAGCSKLHVEKQYTLEPGTIQHVEVSPPTSDQKLKVSVTSDEPVTVTVLLVKDIPAAKGGAEDIDPGTLTTGGLGQKKDVKEATLDVTVPAKEKYRVYISGVKKLAKVTVKIDEQ